MRGNLSRQFHKQTGYNLPVNASPIDRVLWPKEWTKIEAKEYSRFKKIPLPADFLEVGKLEDALYFRRSEREYDIHKKLELKELSTLLRYSAGIRIPDESFDETRRFYPSGGKRYPLEVYLAIQRVEGIRPGIYHFNIRNFCLEEMTTKKAEMERLKEGVYLPWAREASVLFFITACWERTFQKYHNRGYRIALMEAGHMAQNLSLVAAALNIKNCNLVGFNNNRIEEVLDITFEDEDSLYLTVLGK